MAIEDWISVKEDYENSVKCGIPKTEGYRYCISVSPLVLVKIGESGYPFIAHMIADCGKYKSHAHFFKEEDGVRYTWLNGHHDYLELQRITHWKPLPKMLIN